MTPEPDNQIGLWYYNRDLDLYFYNGNGNGISLETLLNTSIKDLAQYKTEDLENNL